MSKTAGFIELIIGPMYAGKSTELLKHIHKYKFLNKNMLIINHKINQRYGTDKIVTHDKVSFNDCINLENLAEVFNEENLENFKNSDIIIIEEVQFFKDAFKQILRFADIFNKKVICAGLSGDYKRENFGDIYKLIPIADKITHLRAMCSICKDGTPGPFTKRFTNDKEKQIVGSNEMYKAVCRYHYLHK